MSAFSTFTKGACRVYDIVNNEAVSPFYVAGNIHNLCYARFRTAFFNNSDRRAYAVNQISGAVYTAQIRGDDRQIARFLDFT